MRTLVTLDVGQIVALVFAGLLVGYFAGCVRAAWVELRGGERS